MVVLVHKHTRSHTSSHKHLHMCICIKMYCLVNYKFTIYDVMEIFSWLCDLTFSSKIVYLRGYIRQLGLCSLSLACHKSNQKMCFILEISIFLFLWIMKQKMFCNFCLLWSSACFKCPEF